MAYYSQDGVAIAIIHEGQRRGVSQKGIQIALSTGLVESDLFMHCNDNDPESKKYPYDKTSYDYDSSGIFQQRPAYWGTAQERMDVAHSAGMFYDALNGYDYNSDAHTPGWYAYQVQKCAAEYAYRYDERYPEACEYYDRLAWEVCPAQPGTCNVSGTIGPLVSASAESHPLVGERRLMGYNSDLVPQETGYWCGPAATQIVLSESGLYVTEQQLANEMGTDANGTDYIGQIEVVLDRYVGDIYATVDIPNDPITPQQKDRLWADILRSIDGGWGIVMNWVAPPGNKPIGIKGSETPHYGGGTTYHYIACMGYDDNPNQRACWIADSGFYPFEYWCAFDQVATLIPPKGYTYAAVGPEGGDDMGLTQEEHDKLFQVWGALFNPTSSTSAYAEPGGQLAAKDAIRFTDGSVHTMVTEHRAFLGDPVHINMVKEKADNGDPWAQHVYDLIPDIYKENADAFKARGNVPDPERAKKAAAKKAAAKKASGSKS